MFTGGPKTTWSPCTCITASPRKESWFPPTWAHVPHTVLDAQATPSHHHMLGQSRLGPCTKLGAMHHGKQSQGHANTKQNKHAKRTAIIFQHPMHVLQVFSGLQGFVSGGHALHGTAGLRGGHRCMGLTHTSALCPGAMHCIGMGFTEASFLETAGSSGWVAAAVWSRCQ